MVSPMLSILVMGSASDRMRIIRLISRATTRSSISEEDEGLVLHLDIAKLDADARRKVEAVLEKALGAVRMQEHGRGDKA